MDTRRGSKWAKIAIDVVFGLFILWLLYVYVLYRFKVDIHFDNQRLTPDSELGKALTFIIASVTGVIAQSVGNGMAEAVGRALTLMAHIVQISYHGIRRWPDDIHCIY